jgi:ATP-dependent Clp protease adaptor protein ClpS
MVPRLPETGGTMGGMAAPQVAPVETPGTDEMPVADRAWVTIVWDDPVNLMSYVTWVFQKLFGYSRDKAEKRMEHDASQLHAYGLWATVDKA